MKMHNAIDGLNSSDKNDQGNLPKLNTRSNFRFQQALLIILLLFTTPTLCQTDSSEISNLCNRILTLDQTIRNDPSRQVSNFNPSDTASLPLGIVKQIRQTIYIICIDSAYFTPQGAFFNVYMALWTFPIRIRKLLLQPREFSSTHKA